MKLKLNNSTHKWITLLFKKKKKVNTLQHDPEGDWERVLIALTSLLFIVIIVNAFFFYKLNNGDLFKATPLDSNTPQLFNKSILKQTNDYYDARQEKFNSLQTIQATSTPVIDPSV